VLGQPVPRAGPRQRAGRERPALTGCPVRLRLPWQGRSAPSTACRTPVTWPTSRGCCWNRCSTGTGVQRSGQARTQARARPATGGGRDALHLPHRLPVAVPARVVRPWTRVWSQFRRWSRNGTGRGHSQLSVDSVAGSLSRRRRRPLPVCSSRHVCGSPRIVPW